MTTDKGKAARLTQRDVPGQSGTMQRDRDGFEIVLALAGMTTPSQVLGVLARRAGALGLPTYAIGSVPAPVSPGPRDFFHHNWPAIWPEIYARRGFAAIDPTQRAAARSLVPLTCSAIKAGCAGFVPDASQRAMFREAEALGMCDGVIVPLFGPHGYQAMACFVGPGPEPTPRVMAELHLLAIHAHARLLALHHTAAKCNDAVIALSEREREVLRAAIHGNGDARIAQDLGISLRTVRFHFASIRNKLEAKSRMEAIARAVNLHLVHG